MEKGLVRTIIATAAFVGGLALATAGVKKDSDWMMYGGIGSTTAGACILGRKIAQDSEEIEQRRIYEETKQKLDAASYD